ncbi:MAG: hypothetical protein JST05_09840 [Acidobacteria bacterium]|nr:hypothetical protein [Acidobacteriota bacterium]
MIHPGLCRHLSGHRVPFALIGAVALAMHGVARFTADVDLMATDPQVLRPAFWNGFDGPRPVLTQGDAEDPLAGVARFALSPQHDLIVGKSAGTRLALESAERLEGIPCPVVTPLALLALKAEAGSPQDAHDARALLEAQAQLGNTSLAGQFRELLPSLGKDPLAFVTRFRLLEGL